MHWAVFVVLLLLWVLGYAFGVAGPFIHLLLVAALAVLVMQLLAAPVAPGGGDED